MISTFVIATLLLIPQGGQGGAGGSLGRQGRDGVEPGVEESFKHILTPGDKTEWPINAKAGEVIILRAESEVFDPGIEVTDSEGKKIGENDDEEAGMQNARLLIYIEKEGTYKAHVKNYRSAAGGPYVLSVRRFMTTNLVPRQPIQVAGQDEPLYLRVVSKKGDIFSLGGDRRYPILNLYGPDGKAASRFTVSGGELDSVFKAEIDGAYYAAVNTSGDPERKESIVALPANRHDAVIGAPARVSSEKHAIDVWKFKAKETDLFRFKASADGPTLLALQNVTPLSEGRSTVLPFQIISEGRKVNDSKLVLFNKEGEYEAYVLNDRDRDLAYTFEATQAWSTWDGVSPLNGNLAVGQRAYYRLDLKPGYLARLTAMAKTFDIAVDLYNLKWQRVLALDDNHWNDSNLSTNLAFMKGGQFYLLLSCFGDGGGGPFSLSANPILPTPIAIGELKQGKSESPMDGLWSLQVQKPGVYGIRVKGAVGSVSIILPDGTTLGGREVYIRDGDHLIVFDAPTPGEYRLWRQHRGTPETYSIKVAPIED